MDDLDIKIRQLRKLINEDKNNPIIVNLSRRLTQGYSNLHCKGQAIYFFIKDNINFLRDPGSVGQNLRPIVTLSLGHGDCDEMLTTYAAIAHDAGLKVRAKAIQTNGKMWDHIYPLFLSDDGTWIPVDASSSVPFGQEVPNTESRVYDV